MLHTYCPLAMLIQRIYFLHLTISEIYPGQDFHTQDHYSKIKLHIKVLWHNTAGLRPLTNVPAKYQLPTHSGFCDIPQTRISHSRSLRQGQRSNQGHTMRLHTNPRTNIPIKYQHLTTSGFLRYSLDKLFPPTCQSGQHG